MNQPDQSKLVPETEAAANAKSPEAPKTRVTKKQTQKDNQVFSQFWRQPLLPVRKSSGACCPLPPPAPATTG